MRGLILWELREKGGVIRVVSWHVFPGCHGHLVPEFDKKRKNIALIILT